MGGIGPAPFAGALLGDLGADVLRIDRIAKPGVEPDLPPRPLNLVADLGGGALYLVVGLLAAAMEARRSGRGQTIDVAMIDGVTHLMSAFQAFRQQGSWTERRADNIVDGGAPFYRSYGTKDGKFVAVGAIEPDFYANLVKVMGIDGENLPDQNERAAWPQMRERFAKFFAMRTRDEWVADAAERAPPLPPDHLL